MEVVRQQVRDQAAWPASPLQPSSGARARGGAQFAGKVAVGCLAVAYGAGIVVLIIIIWQLVVVSGAERHTIAWFVAGLFVAVTVPVTVVQSARGGRALARATRRAHTCDVTSSHEFAASSFWAPELVSGPVQAAVGSAYSVDGTWSSVRLHARLGPIARLAGANLFD